MPLYFIDCAFLLAICKQKDRFFRSRRSDHSVLVLRIQEAFRADGARDA
uniref:Uncharacterized protein n=1 Tax=Arundo donax TaxID=35708 RepID=A0A0A9B2E4_ARUDO